MGVVLSILAIAAIGYVAWSAHIVMRGNNYHRLIREAVVRDLGMVALPYLESPPVIEQITAAFARGEPAVITAIALTAAIRRAEEGHIAEETIGRC